MLKVSPWRGVIRFGKCGKLSPRFIGPFKVIERIGPVAYKLELPDKLRGIHDTFHVSNLREIMDREVKRLKQSRIPIVKVRWNSRRGPEFTWELIDNDIYSTVDACPNACEMWKAIERLKQGESINVQDLETNLYWEFGKFTKRDGESLESYYSRSQQAATRNRGKAIVNSPQPIYDQEPSMVAKDDEIGVGYDNQRLGNIAGARETVGTTVVQKYGIQWYNCKEFGHVASECQKPKREKDVAYYREKMLLCKQEEAGIQLNVEQANWRDDTDDEPDDQELKAHYMYQTMITILCLPLNVNILSNLNLFMTHPIEQDEHNMIIDSLDMSYDSEQIDQNDDDNDLA
nr:putative reverse transcriptase domain-containing protein [Tanacetum cinerariifolium]